MSTQALSTVGDRGLQLQTLDDVLRFARMVLAARLAPKSFKDESQIVVALQMGMEVGLPPMQSLQSIAVINGNPAIYGDGGTALVRSSGLLEDMVEEYVGEGDQLTAVCKLKRKGQAGWIVGTFSVADAKKARLWGKQGPWTDYPPAYADVAGPLLGVPRRLRGRAARDALRRGGARHPRGAPGGPVHRGRRKRHREPAAARGGAAGAPGGRGRATRVRRRPRGRNARGARRAPAGRGLRLAGRQVKRDRAGRCWGLRWKQGPQGNAGAQPTYKRTAVPCWAAHFNNVFGVSA